MPYTKPNKTSTTPRLPARRPRRRDVDVFGPQNPTATIIEASGTWNFSARVWIAFDPPSSTSPTWIDISGFVQTGNPITITHGRSDGLSDVNASTCSLTVDNSGGQFLAANTAGPWYGQVHKGNWLKVDVYPPSGTVSTRFVGFITSLPNQWSGQSQYGLISASDRFEKLQQSPAIISSPELEVLTDPNLSGNVKGYWNLHEAQGSLSFGDTSGQGAQYMKAMGLGVVSAGTGFAASNAAGPGFDGLRAATFNPVSTSQGTYLTAPITAPTGTWTSGLDYTGLAGVVSFWYQATATDLHCLAAIVDPASQFAFTVYQDHDGTLSTAYCQISQGGAIQEAVLTTGFGYIGDGKWHHIAVATAATNQLGGACVANLYLDGTVVQAGWRSGITGANGNFTQLIVGAGYLPTPLQLGAGNISDVSWYWGDLSSSATYVPVSPPNLADHYAAGSTGFSGESTDHRIARIARYAGVPIPLTNGPSPSYGGSTRIYNPIQGPWTNLQAGAHLCGTQSMAGRKPLDVMFEAAHTEGMPLYVDRAGYLEIQPSTTRQNTTPAWTVNALELDPSTQVADDFAYTTNQATITPNGQAAQTVISVPNQPLTTSPGYLSQVKYGIYDGSQSTASVNPVEAQSLGLSVIQLRSDPPPRLAPLAIEAATLALLPGYGSAWYDEVLATEISTPVRVTNAPAAVGAGNYDCLVEGWTETITAANHAFAFNVSPIQGPTYQLDDPVLGRLDTDGTTLQGTLNTTATTFTAAVATATSAAWTTNTADFPFDIMMDAEQMTVTAVAPVPIGVDGTFESGITGWTLGQGTFVQSTAQAHSGTHSGLLTRTGTAFVTATTARFTVYPNATYQFSQWSRLAAGAPVYTTAFWTWFDGSGAQISFVSDPLQITPTTTWTNQTITVTAPANAATANIQLEMNAAAVNDAVYFDDVTVTLLTGGQQQFTVTRSVNGVVASHTSGASLALAEALTLAY